MVSKILAKEKLCICFYLDNNQSITGKAGAISAVVKAMKMHMQFNEICLQGCCGLWNMTFNRKKEKKYNPHNPLT